MRCGCRGRMSFLRCLEFFASMVNVAVYRFTGWSVRFDYSDIIEAKRVDVSWRSWGGFGWRWRPGRIGYLVRSGPGVKIATKRSRRTYTFNCQDRDALLAALGNAGVTIADRPD